MQLTYVVFSLFYLQMSIFIYKFLFIIFFHFFLTLLYICVKSYNIYTAIEGAVPFPLLISTKLLIVSVDVNNFLLIYFFSISENLKKKLVL